MIDESAKNIKNKKNIRFERFFCDDLAQYQRNRRCRTIIFRFNCEKKSFQCENRDFH